ncbi:hypothetical protein ADUPG1_012119 [Aduncisulcus paluster]|uniref:Chromo domain-containing protein n=1 Tax=Aduncisulcus paluster TaxID=2918883 RepID=A0ABQ5JYC6_9EUKA|nr:hypothetical protein ADUPG1_012119 [Aduncisulcus paluster]
MIAGGLPSVEWVDALPSVQFLMNTQEHSALGITPFELMFGRETTNLFDILREKQTHDLKLGNRKSKELARRYLDYRKELMDELVEKARKIQEKFKKNEELELVMEGDAVWLVPNKKKKLSARLRGPFIIKKVFPRNMANISSLTDDSTLRVHLRRLVPVKGSHSMQELRSMAATAEGEWVIECITDHKGDTPDELQFFVQWFGFDPSESTWEYLWNVKDSIAFGKYLVEHEELREIVDLEPE